MAPPINESRQRCNRHSPHSFCVGRVPRRIARLRLDDGEAGREKDNGLDQRRRTCSWSNPYGVSADVRNVCQRWSRSTKARNGD